MFMVSAQISAKKGQGIDDVLGILTPSPIDNQQRAHTTGFSLYERVLQRYEQLLSLNLTSFNRISPFNVNKDILDSYFNTVREILAPAEINVVLQALVRYEPLDENHLDGTGFFISALIQNSYDAGNNNFCLEMESKKVNYLGSGLYGEKKRPLVLTVDGNVGYSFCSEATFVHATVNGSANYFCSEKSKHCRFTLESIPLGSWDVHDNIYRTRFQGTHFFLKKNVPVRRRNKIFLIDKEEGVRKS